MNDLQMRILEVLTDDARTSVAQIAIMLGRAETEVAEAIRELEEKRVILKYPALINWDKVESGEVEALIEVRVTPQRDHGFDAIAEQIYRFEEVRNVYLMSGGYDLLVMLKAPTLKKLALFVAEKLSTIEGVLSTATHFVLKRYKNEGVITDEKQADRRLKITP
ncbi:MAG TPA: Lrp/AsnC family transcriptional regulator [Candidatus Pullichristensenella excrementipullorum]|nr:Lrp/AsnC family transcriptional regulator [Candidatus Pullichristensenella excrementipullorum]